MVRFTLFVGMLRDIRSVAASTTAARPANGSSNPLDSMPAGMLGDVDVSQYKDQAQQIWSMLDEMAEKDPAVRMTSLAHAAP